MRQFLFLFLWMGSSLFGVETHLPYSLKVEGNGEVSIKATLADVRLGIEVEGKNSSSVQSDLSERQSRLVAKLEERKVQKVQTTTLSVFPLYTDEHPASIRGYRGNAEVVFTEPIESAGDVMAYAMEFGATKINGIELKAKEEDLDAARKKAVQKACENGMALAKTALATLNLELKEVMGINLTPQDHPQPFPRMMAYEASNRVLSAPNLQGEQTVRSQVILTLIFKETLDY